MEKIKYTLAVSLGLLLLVAGCGVDKVTGHVTADLIKKNLGNGASTTLEVNGKNTGNVAAEVILKIIPEDSSKLIITYPGSLEDYLQPNEEIGKKILNVQGFTDHSSTTYWIKVQLRNKATGDILDEEVIYITVKK